jgi:hypothetical protein
MPGWIVQLYEKLPVAENWRLNDAPGLIVPEFHELDVDVCATLSAFIHVTVDPTATVTGFGE